eukprot:359704-Chlamydomonas_euryale.AAC.2
MAEQRPDPAGRERVGGASAARHQRKSVPRLARRCGRPCTCRFSLSAGRAAGEVIRNASINEEPCTTPGGSSCEESVNLGGDRSPTRIPPLAPLRIPYPPHSTWVDRRKG